MWCFWSYDCLPYELLIAKPHAYGFDMKSVNIMFDYLPDIRQKVKINKSYSSWQELLYGVPQESVPRLLLFNTFLCDLFFFLEGTDITSYMDIITLCNAKITPELVINKLEESF